jgi:NADH:ubiquinone oxidoreductase subunit 4 (subunit M)
VRVERASFVPLTWKEATALLALVFAILWIGIHPRPLLERSEAAVAALGSRLRVMGEVMR